MSGHPRSAHFLGTKLKGLRKRNGLTLDELSARCVQLDVAVAPSTSYLSMLENGKRTPSRDLLALLAQVFGKTPEWFLDDSQEPPLPVPRPGDRPVHPAGTPPLEPAFLFSKALLQAALPELLAQTGTSGRHFAQLLIRVWQETKQNDFPEIERAAEDAGGRRMPLSVDELLEICRAHGLRLSWSDGERAADGRTVLRARYESPGTLVVNRRMNQREERLKYELAFFLGHQVLHGGDGMISPHTASGILGDDMSEQIRPGMAAQDVLYAWRDFECSLFAGALLCPRQPFRQYLMREAHSVTACTKLGVTPAVVMRRMTAVSPYRHWHFFDGYPPGYLRAVYRGNGIALPWGNMSLVPDPCPRWAVFKLLHDSAAHGATGRPPISQISVMDAGLGPRLYCCHSLHTEDAGHQPHVLSVGIDLAPALDAQGLPTEALIESVASACRRGKGQAALSPAVRKALQTVAQVQNIAWIADAAERPATLICPRSGVCPLPSPCTSARAH
jgi:transcriptional regulator with XRE-family HTH domain